MRGEGLFSAPRVTPSSAEVATSPGIYAWWGVTEVPWPRVFPGVDPASPLYIGIAVGETLSDRILDCHLSRTRSSALRRSLAALLAKQLSLKPHLIPGTEDRPSKFGLDDDGEAMLTAWMLGHLTVSWVALDAPGDMERALIRGMSPPLNDTHATGSPYRKPMRTMRERFGRVGPPPRDIEADAFAKMLDKARVGPGEIARALGMSHSTIRNWLVIGVPEGRGHQIVDLLSPPGRAFGDEQHQSDPISARQFAGLARALGLSNHDLAARLCVTESTVKAWRRLGVPGVIASRVRRDLSFATLEGQEAPTPTPQVTSPYSLGHAPIPAEEFSRRVDHLRIPTQEIADALGVQLDAFNVWRSDGVPPSNAAKARTTLAEMERRSNRQFGGA